ncbi:hypothetical protein FRB95_005432 [Tulasnella sp. JGI-2019a]|nr:hypothetical protein FRB93_000206 [Tulasnella sp. JGI-2019a]KAG9037493.1 hypothetical protein FRB95_005432 [Tulasnella sp. JGI-2019a]
MQLRDCLVCATKKEDGEYPSATPTTSCAHEIGICKTCMACHLEAEVNSKGLNIVNCPYTGCRKPMEYEDVRRDASAHIFERREDATILPLAYNRLTSHPHTADMTRLHSVRHSKRWMTSDGARLLLVDLANCTKVVLTFPL